jgi:hypothetical protein
MTTGQTGSVVVRRQLGIQLRKLRLAAGKSVMDVTEAGLGSKAKISRIETGKGPVKVADVRTLCWLYGVDAATTDALAALAPGTQQEGWWEEYGDVVVPDWFGLYAGLEAAASRIRFFEPELVHGLLQTPEYATAVFASDPRSGPDVIAQRVRFRMERQRNVLRADPPSIVLIMGESALARTVGSATVMRDQIDRLRTETRADVRVLPFSAGAYPLRRSFALLDFADEEDPSVAYVDVPMGARYFDHDPERAEYEYVFGVIHSKSIPITEWKT